MSEPQTLGAIVKDEREKRGWTIPDLERRSGIGRWYLEAIESEHTEPNANTMYRILTAFKNESTKDKLSDGEYQLLEAWRSRNWSRLLEIVSARIAEEYER